MTIDYGKKGYKIALFAMVLALLAFSTGGSVINYFNNSSCNCTNFSDNLKINKSGDMMTGTLYIDLINSTDNSSNLHFESSLIILTKKTASAYSYLIMNGLLKTLIMSTTTYNSTSIIQSPTQITFNIDNSSKLDILNNLVTTHTELNVTNNNISDVNTISINNGITLQSVHNEYLINYTLPLGLSFPYQFEINISNEAGTNNGTNIYFNGHANNNFSDVYVTQNISNIVSHCVLDNESLWVNITSVGNITINYGNASLIDSSNCGNTFHNFVGSTSIGYDNLSLKMPIPYIAEAKVKTLSTPNAIRWGFTNISFSTPQKTACNIQTDSASNNRYLQCYSNGTTYVNQNEIPSFSLNNFYRIKIINTGTVISGMVDNNEISNSTSTSTISRPVGLFMSFDAGTGYQSYSFIRNYMPNEPVRNSWGTEYINTPIISTWCVRVTSTGVLYTIQGAC